VTNCIVKNLGTVWGSLFTGVRRDRLASPAPRAAGCLGEDFSQLLGTTIANLPLRRQPRLTIAVQHLLHGHAVGSDVRVDECGVESNVREVGGEIGIDRQCFGANIITSSSAGRDDEVLLGE